MAVRMGTGALVTAGGEAVRVGRRLASGGQGEVFEVRAPAASVFKRIFDKSLAEDPSLENRLRAMLANRPSGWRESRSSHVLLSWPTDVVFEGGRFVGFLMPLIDLSETVEFHEIANPSDRRSPSEGKAWTKAFDWRYLVRTAENLALATEMLHDAEVVIGDFNERNILVWSDSRVTLLDCDSMQVAEPGSGRWFLCRVGRPEFTAPELLGADWGTTVRAASSDLFALAVHLHQLLLEGGHPFDGVWHGSGEKPRRHLLARQGLWVHGGDPRLRPRPGAIAADLLPAQVRDLFRRALVDGATNPRSRPTAAEWHVELARLGASLVICTKDAGHSYPQSSPTCPWCDRLEANRARTTLPRTTIATPWLLQSENGPVPGLASVPSAVATPTPAATPRSPSRLPRRSRARWLWAMAAAIVVAIVAGTAYAGRDVNGSTNALTTATTATTGANLSDASGPADGPSAEPSSAASQPALTVPPPQQTARSATSPPAATPNGPPRARSIVVAGSDPRCPAGTSPIAEDHGANAPNCANPAPGEALPAQSQVRFPRPRVFDVESRGACVGGLCPIRVRMEALSTGDGSYWAPIFSLLEDGVGMRNSVEDAGGSTWVSGGSRCFWIVVSYFPKPDIDSGRVVPGFTNPVCLTITADGTITKKTVY